MCEWKWKYKWERVRAKRETWRYKNIKKKLSKKNIQNNIQKTLKNQKKHLKMTLFHKRQRKPMYWTVKRTEKDLKTVRLNTVQNERIEKKSQV